MAALNLAGKTSGYIKLKSPDVALNATVELPNKDGILATLDDVGSGGGGVPEAPTDGKQYARQDENWTEVNHPTRLESNRRLTINGDMRIAQRGTSTASITTGGYYTVDRYSLTLSSLGIWTMSQDNDVPTGQGFAKSLKLACTTADASPASGDLLVIQHKIEAQNLQHLAYGTSSAKTLTMSFWVKSNKTGTYNLHIYQNDDARQFSNSYTITSADTWEKKTITIPADTTGVIDNDNGNGLQIEWVLGAGIDFTAGTNATTWQTYNTNDTAPSNVNLADSTSNYINITGVQLEISDDGKATPFEHRPYDLELQRCQRYYQKSYPYGTAVGSVTNVGRLNVGGGNGTGSTTGFLGGPFVRYKVPMRATATVTVYDDQGNSNKCIRFVLGASNNSNQTIIVADSYNEGFWTYSSGTTNDSGVGIHYQAEAEL